MKFTPSPVKLVRFLDAEGKVIKAVKLNRATRRRLGIRGGKHG